MSLYCELTHPRHKHKHKPMASYTTGYSYISISTCVYIHLKPDRAHDCATLRTTAGTAHTEDNVVTRAVFHAPMFALNADADPNVCEPTTLGPQRYMVSVSS